MTRFFVLTLTVVVATLVLVPGAAVGAAPNQSVNVSTGDDPCSEPEPIDEDTVLCSAELDGNTAVLVVESDRLQRITLTDAGGFLEGGRITRKHWTVKPDQPMTLRIDVTRSDGFAGVAVDTRETLYAVPLESRSPLIAGPISMPMLQAGVLGASISTALIILLKTYRYGAGKESEPERVA
jgi:hypothetical protein